jgi:hypothetical protein
MRAWSTIVATGHEAQVLSAGGLQTRLAIFSGLGGESHMVQRWAANLAMLSALDVRIAEQDTL